MKKKNYEEDSEENEFEVDEPDELQENSDDDWAPAKGKGGAKRASVGKKGSLKKKKKTASSDDDEEEEETPKKKKGAAAAKGKAAAAAKKSKSKKKDEEEDDEDLNEEELEDEELDDEEVEEEEDEEEEEIATEGNVRAPKEFSSGAFVVLKTDFNTTEDPPIWKIDGKALLQKYVPFEQDGKTLYKNTSVYSGWTINNKDQYYPATVVFKQQTRKEHVVDFQRDLIQKEETAEIE